MTYADELSPVSRAQMKATPGLVAYLEVLVGVGGKIHLRKLEAYFAFDLLYRVRDACDEFLRVDQELVS